MIQCMRIILIALVVTIFPTMQAHRRCKEAVNVVHDACGNYYIIKDNAACKAPQGMHGVMKRHTHSLMVGAAIGGTVGALCGCIDARAPGFFLLTWYIAYHIRNGVTESIIEAMEEEDVKHSKRTLRDASWLSSWASWILTLSLLRS
jgi:hypothetical protein